MSIPVATVSIGLSARLGQPRSPHLDAFERAIASAQCAYPELGSHYRLVYVDDEASPSGGARAARSLLAEGADVVIGHFASGAARAALSVYASTGTDSGAGIAVILPAATAMDLLQAYPRACRICNSDQSMARAVAHYFSEKQVENLSIEDDGSVHGIALTACIEDALKYAGIGVVDRAAAQHQLFTGMYAQSVEFANRIRTAGYDGTVYFTDDAQHPSLGVDLYSSSDVFVFGYAPADGSADSASALARYNAKWHASPGIYYMETLAALEMVFECLQQHPSPAAFRAALLSGCWRTSLGKLEPSLGELGHGKFGLWQPVAQDLHLICPVQAPMLDNTIQQQSALLGPPL